MAKKTTAKKADSQESQAQEDQESQNGRKPEKAQTPAPDAPATAAVHSTLKPPPGGAAVRMYRIGHGDCFLIAFAGETPTSRPMC